MHSQANIKIIDFQEAKLRLSPSPSIRRISFQEGCDALALLAIHSTEDLGTAVIHAGKHPNLGSILLVFGSDSQGDVVIATKI